MKLSWSILFLSVLPLFGMDNGFEWISSDCQLIAKLDVSSSLAIEGVREAFQGEKPDPDLVKMRELGFKPFEDIEDAYFGMKDLGQEKSGQFVAVIRFNRKLDLGKVIRGFSSWKKEEIRVSSYRGVDLFTSVKDTDQTFFSDQIDGEWSLVGDLDLLKKAIDRLHGDGQAITQNQDLMALTNQGSLPHLLWAAGSLAMPGLTSSFKNTLLTLDYMKGLQIGGRIPFSSPEEKQQINQGISMVSGILMMMSQGAMDPSNISVEEKNDFIRFHVTLPDSMLAMLKQQAETMSEASKDTVHQD